MRCRRAFTLIEMLISTALISLVLVGLYQSLNIQEHSNRLLHHYLQKAENEDREVMVLYNDLLSSDGNLSLKKGEFDRLCINRTLNTLYDLDLPKVCWVVLKEKNTLVRVEGTAFSLPLKPEDSVAVDVVMEDMELFDVYRNKGDLLVVLQAKNRKPYSFVIQGLVPPPIPKPKPKAKKGKGNTHFR